MKRRRKNLRTGPNASATDSWTPVHIATGALAGAIGVPFWAAFGGAALYEVAEYAHEYPKGSKIFGSKRPESPPNVAVDMAVFAGGWALLNALRKS